MQRLADSVAGGVTVLARRVKTKKARRARDYRIQTRVIANCAFLPGCRSGAVRPSSPNALGVGKKIQFCPAVRREKIFDSMVFGADEAQIRFHAGEAVGREAGAFFEAHPDLVSHRYRRAPKVPRPRFIRLSDPEPGASGLRGFDRRKDRPEARTRAGSAVAQSDRGRNSSQESSMSGARGCRPCLETDQPCRSGRTPRTPMRPACRQSNEPGLRPGVTSVRRAGDVVRLIPASSTA